VRVVFDDIREFIEWIATFVRDDRHVAYITSKHEVIVVPKVSTKPLVMTYIKETDIAPILQAFEERNVTTFKVKSFDWKDDTPVGSSFLLD